MMGLTAKQRELYDFIAAEIAKNGIAPSFGEMAKALDLGSKSQVAQLIGQLEDRGYIHRLPRKERAIEIIASGSAVTLNAEILTLTDKYAAEHGLSRDTAANELIRTALQAA